MTTASPILDKQHLDTLREYQWLSPDVDLSFSELLQLVLSLTQAEAAGIAVNGLDSIRYIAGEGVRELFDSRLLDECQILIKSSQHRLQAGYAGVPLLTPEGLIIGSLFVADSRAKVKPESLEQLNAFARLVMITLEARRGETRLHEAKEALKHKQRALLETKKLHRDFLAHLSHEMRTPLHVILGLSEILQGEVRQAPHDSLVQKLRKSSQHMLETLDGILEQAKLEATTLRLHPSPFDLREFLDETLTPFETIVEARGLSFRTNLKLPEAAICSADRVRLRQVLNNLITNAIKFTEKGSIQVDVDEIVSPPDDERHLFVFRITDTGLGIHRFDQALLFEPYQQASVGSSKGGSGLGLSICKQLVEGMNGQIGLESEFGEGSTFWFKIPLTFLQDEQNSSLPLALATEAQSGLRESRAERILVVEDNSISRTMTTKTLEQRGYTLTSADTLELVQRHLKDSDFDLILLDLHIGDLSPARLLEEVRAHSAAPLVAISGSQLRSGDDPCRSIDDSLLKPYTREALLETVEYWILADPRLERLREAWQTSLRSLEESCGCQFVHKTIRDFIKRHPTEIQKLQRYLDEENWSKLELAAHSMKATLATLGLIELSLLVTEVEAVSQTQDRAHLESLIAQLRIDSRRTYPQLLADVNKKFTLMPCEIAS